MAPHRFQIGDRVRIVRPKGRNVVEAFLIRYAPASDISVWTIVRIGPSDEIGARYHVRSERGISRVVQEDEIERV